ncbi:hypothetical protein GN244_ATG11220 [Phytophthora infestans]|uniref:Uncharacterized protein n=1 Tax=Phytophthora infestans TaxID=4787 RepID=A0A833W0A4_PHYIN|nr:hypothetical protein GN244_ATG11220 [Phytophthora infestans]
MALHHDVIFPGSVSGRQEDMSSVGDRPYQAATSSVDFMGWIYDLRKHYATSILVLAHTDAKASTMTREQAVSGSNKM